MKKNGFTLIELLTVIAIALILLGMVVGAIGGCTVSDGQRAGTLQKFSYKGIAKKSWEGELTQSSSLNGQVTSTTWAFSVVDPEVAKQMETLVSKNVIIKYHQTYNHNPLTRNTDYIAISVHSSE